MKILTQNLKTGKTDIVDVPSPTSHSNKIKLKNKYSLISTGTESLIVNFGKAGWLKKAMQQPDRVKDVINKIKSSGLGETYKAIKNKLNLPMPMGYSAVGVISCYSEKHNLSVGTRIFSNSFHQEEALVDYNMCIEIPDEVDDRSATFGAIGGIAIQSIECIPKKSKSVAIIGLGLLGQVTLRILNAQGYDCIVYDIDEEKINLAIKDGLATRAKKDIKQSILNYTHGAGVDCTIIAASSLSSDIVNDATDYTKRKGKIISSGLVGLNLIRDKFFKKQIELVISNSSGDKNHRGKGSSYENISYFFELLSSKRIEVLDLITEEISINNPSDIYSIPKDSIYFSKLIKYDVDNINCVQTFSNVEDNKSLSQLRVGLIGAGNFAMSTLIPTINNSKKGYLSALLGREGLSLYVAKKKFSINTITTNELDFYKNIDVVCITTPHETHFNFVKKAIELSLPLWIEKPLVISNKELVAIKKEMLSNKLVYHIGYNRSLAPWTSFIKNKIGSKKINVEMTINAGKLPAEHFLLNENVSGGRIVGEFCHFVDLMLKLLNHTKIINVECIDRDRYFQDTGSYFFTFEDGSKVNINYRHDLPASVPKEKITVEISNSIYVNNNWKKFSNGKIFNFDSVKKGKGHNESIASFFDSVNNDNFSTENEINAMCFSTYISIKLQKMSKGEVLNIIDCYQDEILSNS